MNTRDLAPADPTTPTVLSVAYPFAPVGPDAVGGAEQILATLEAGLVAAGCQSIVLGCPGSRAQGVLRRTLPMPARIDDAIRRRAWRVCRERIARLVSSEKVDLVHMHGVDFAEYLPPPGVPTVVTLHLPLDAYPSDILALRERGVHLVCVSENQRAAGGAAWAHAPVVDNGVASTDDKRVYRKRRFALTLGRICPEKAFEDAVRGARQADLPLLIGGRVFPYPAHERYYREVLVPLFNARCRYAGALFGRRKRRLLASAQCLIVPSRVAETSSLVVMEALMVGTPVVARRLGALPDLIEDGHTGFLIDDVSQMAAAIARCAALDPAACRLEARRRFSAERMIERYLDLYRALLPLKRTPRFATQRPASPPVRRAGSSGFRQ